MRTLSEGTGFFKTYEKFSWFQNLFMVWAWPIVVPTLRDSFERNAWWGKQGLWSQTLATFSVNNEDFYHDLAFLAFPILNDEPFLHFLAHKWFSWFQKIDTTQIYTFEATSYK